MNTEVTSRNGAIDAVKGVCLLHMLFVHLSIIYGAIDFCGNGAGLYFHIMEWFMIPFYLFNGYFFSQKNNFKSFITSKAKRLLTPLLFWSLISLPFFYFWQYNTHGFIEWKEPFLMFIQICSLSSNDALWFLYSLFAVNVIFYVVYIYTKNEKIVLSFIILCLLYAYVDRYCLPCYFSSSNITIGLVFFYIGHKFRMVENKLMKKKILLLSITIFIAITYFDPQWMQIVTLYQSEGYFSLNILYALTGTYILYFVMTKLKYINMFSYFGHNSMTYYVWHMIPLRLIWDPLCKEYFPQISYSQYVVVGGAIILITSYIIDALKANLSQRVVILSYI